MCEDWGDVDQVEHITDLVGGELRHSKDPTEREFHQIVTMHPDFLRSSQQTFHTGAVRDTAAGKPDYTLLSWPELARISNHYKRNIGKYGRDNWKKGIPSSRYLQSMLRHAASAVQEEDNEDHLAAIAFNVMGIMYNQRVFPDDATLNDLGGWSGDTSKSE